jgi:hypothetical protein
MKVFKKEVVNSFWTVTEGAFCVSSPVASGEVIFG